MFGNQIKTSNWFIIIVFCLFNANFFMSCQAEKSQVSTTAHSTQKKSTTIPQVDSIFETFEHKTKDTTYLMKKYFICFLKTGPTRDQKEALAEQIQKEHLAHMDALAEAKKICAAGPMGDDGDIKGIIVYSVANQEEAESLANSDPAVKAGRLTVEVHPWWAAVGTTLF